MIIVDPYFSQGLLEVIHERTDQVYKHKISVYEDTLHNPEGQLIQAARALLKEQCVLHDFPDSWGVAICRKMASKSYQERKIIAAALIVADYDRIDYLEKLKEQAEKV